MLLQATSELQYETLDGCGGWGSPFGCHAGYANLTVTTSEPYVQPFEELGPHKLYQRQQPFLDNTVRLEHG